MNWQHIQAFLWLHSRLLSNRLRRGGTLGVVMDAIVSLVAVLLGGVMFLIALSAGIVLMPKAQPAVLMLVWDGLAIGFLFLWLGELISELQRDDAISLEKLLHLPVSLAGLFLINYAASFYSLSVTIFLPAMLGLSLGLVISKGPVMLSLFPMVAAFFVMLTALAYQFRGWLASLMQNKRHRRNVMAIATISLVLVSQLPGLYFWMSQPSRATQTAAREEIRKLDRQFASRTMDATEYQRQSDAIRQKYGLPNGGRRNRLQDIERIATTANMFIPLGWLAYGAFGSAQRSLLPALLATLGMGLIGALCLIRSYRTTVQLYTGQFTSVHRSAHDQALQKLTSRDPRTSAALMEKVLPWISEHASAIALSCFRSLTRAPEGKMMLLTPLTFSLIFGFMFLRVSSSPTEFKRLLMAVGSMTLSLLALSQLAGNQFGLDRSGFRAFVLTPAPREDILLGKNLALLPFAMGFGLISASLVEIMYPMRVDHLAGALVQMVSMYFVFCILTNLMSMLAPMAFPAGSLRPAKPKGIAILFHLGFLVLFPVMMSLTLTPLGIAFLLDRSGFVTPFPTYFLLTVLELAAVLYLYSRALKIQGVLLQSREQKILETVASRVD